MRYLQPLLAIAQNTFRETIRDRVLYVLIVFAFLLTLGASLIGSLSVGQELRILEDIGLFTISLIGGIIAIFVGTTLVYKEMERRSIFIIFTKPISRWQFVSGKFIGLVLCVFLVTAAMGFFLALTVWLLTPDHQVSPLLFESLALIFLELCFVTGLATFFSTFATPVMSVIFTTCAWFIAHLSSSLKDLSQVSTSGLFNQLGHFLYWLLPDLSKLTQIRADLMYGHQPEPELLFYLIAYISAYIMLLLCCSTIITEGKEIS